ncbi:MAG: hypothetical protein JNK15_20400 [Planctomycetes bacterium]|nr:hypothetical protein [Planctomycetota bacterium]
MDEAGERKRRQHAFSCACQWGVFWLIAGLAAGASWRDAVLFGAVAGGLLGWTARVGIFRFLWDVVTLREYQFWKHPDV